MRGHEGISKNNTLRSVRSVGLTHLTLERKLQIRTCNMSTCPGNGTQEWAVQDLLCLVDLYLVYLI